MSDLSNQASSNGEQAPAPRRRGRGWLFITTIALAAALTGGLTTRALTHGGFGPGWHGPGFMRGPLGPADIESRADRAMRHVAIELDATNEQQEKLRSIAKSAIKDLLPLREKAQAARQRGAALLTQPSVDRAAIEAVRKLDVKIACCEGCTLLQRKAAEIL